MKFILMFFIFSLFTLNCGTGKSNNNKEQKREVKMAELKISSSAFENNDTIPKKYTCDGEDISPPITWGGVTGEIKSLVLICDDPDAPMGTWVHWVVYNIPPQTEGFSEGVESIDTLDSGAIQGMTDFGRVGYGGPCPPSGPVHHYHFKLYGLDKMLEAEEKINKEQLLKKMEGHIVAKGELIGLCKR